MTLRELYLRWRTTHDWRDVRDSIILAGVVAVLIFYVWKMFSWPKTL